MDTIYDLMRQLDGADAATVNRIAWDEGSLPERLAMPGLAAARKGDSPLGWGYPPGVFISSEWKPAMQAPLLLAQHVRARPTHSRATTAST